MLPLASLLIHILLGLSGVSIHHTDADRAGQPTAAQSPAATRVRTLGWGTHVSIPSRLLPDDELVVVSIDGILDSTICDHLHTVGSLIPRSADPI
jgi:hypothetical protein